VTDKQILSASGSNGLQVHSTTDPDFPLVQTLEAHKVGCHHVVTDERGSRAVSVGFGGEVLIWTCQDGAWSKTKGVTFTDVWAIALSADGQYLAGTTQNGHIKVWDLGAHEEEIRDHETKGSFGTCIDLVSTSNTHTCYSLKFSYTRYSHPMADSSLVDMKMAVSISLARRRGGCHLVYQVTACSMGLIYAPGKRQQVAMAKNVS
jgi:WD40 repeat protein